MWLWCGCWCWEVTYIFNVCKLKWKLMSMQSNFIHKKRACAGGAVVASIGSVVSWYWLLIIIAFTITANWVWKSALTHLFFLYPADFFGECISEQDLDEMNIEIIRNTLYKAYLESFYGYCKNLGGTTAQVMCEILAVSIYPVLCLSVWSPSCSLIISEA